LASHLSDSTKYKKSVQKYEEESPQEWINMLKDLEEIWTQNPMTGGRDIALVRGESALAFETALQDASVIAEDEPVPNSTDHVQEEFKAVIETAFLIVPWKCSIFG
jgi:hypothetical protein